MASLSRLVIIGTVGQDPVLRRAPEGSPITTFPVVVKQKINDDPEATWFPIVVFNRLAEYCGIYLSKGLQVYVEGPVSVRGYDTAEGGQGRCFTVLASHVLCLDAGIRCAPSVPSSLCESPDVIDGEGGQDL